MGHRMRLSQPPFRSLLAPQRLLAHHQAPSCPRHVSAYRTITTQTTTPAHSRRIAPPFQTRQSSSSSSSRHDHHTQSISAADLQFGQPLHETHPHILNAGELTPGITAQEYADRRAALASKLPLGAVAILPSATIQYKSGAVFHPFRQESNFFYLTGWQEPDSLALIQNTGPARDDYSFCMFVKPKNPREEQWNGYRNGVAAARDVFNADEAWSIEEADTMLPRILGLGGSNVNNSIHNDGGSRGGGGGILIYADSEAPSNANANANANTNALTRLLARHHGSARRTPLYPITNSLRAIKSPAEVANMRLAGQISGRAITAAMRRPWTRERLLHAFLDHQFSSTGCDGPAYIPVVAGGPRANCIHYTVNNQTLSPPDLVLVDAGAEYGSYVTDISRTWPLSGTFSPAQKDLYAAVLAVQRSALSLCRQNANLSLEDIHLHTARALADNLAQIGFHGISTANIHELFPHHVGHYVGIDVHDCPGLSRREALRKGHCITIEPGIYVPQDDDKWPVHFRGMGIRIEDSVCVDTESPYILTTEAVKEIADIEALRD